ncbi:uncharacterized protein N7483_007113 [Penicillium malachiteum]|uniref:uncharacterized protein n=1 Tax=Penicillium malachiteum TaxID=1324776 RepID=UPI002546A602|nr:uncharacterized protein N7483_007113 [Penicillium malachiteum]KAJ5725756.1 hypothetical protein N7483_007113 [Penicillium malachiteum]
MTTKHPLEIEIARGIPLAPPPGNATGCRAISCEDSIFSLKTAISETDVSETSHAADLAEAAFPEFLPDVRPESRDEIMKDIDSAQYDGHLNDGAQRWLYYG